MVLWLPGMCSLESVCVCVCVGWALGVRVCVVRSQCMYCVVLCLWVGECTHVCCAYTYV